MGAHRSGATVVISPTGKANMPFGLELGAGPGGGAQLPQKAVSHRRRVPPTRAPGGCPALAVESSWSHCQCHCD